MRASCLSSLGAVGSFAAGAHTAEGPSPDRLGPTAFPSGPAALGASTMLVSSIARVIGPTPPTGGAREPATWSTSGWTSPRMPSTVRVMPTDRTVRRA